MTQSKGDPALPDARLRLDRLPPEGRPLEVAATNEQLQTISDRMKVSDVGRFSATVKAEPLRGGIRVTGSLAAEITQPCVVTLEPVTQSISEPLDRMFLPKAAEAQPTPGSEVFVDLDAEDEPDAIEGGEVDLMPFLLETLALAIDPYPRAPGAELPDGAKDEDENDSPFAKLRALKEKGE